MSTTTAPRVSVTYEPRGAALELFRRREAEVCIAGPAGTGKSMAALWRLHTACLTVPRVRALIVRKTAVSLGSTTLNSFEKRVAGPALAAGALKWFGGSTREPAGYVYANGSRIVVGGMDNPTKIMSSEYDLVFADEATELTVEDWEAIGTRLRNGVLAWQQQIAACNPGAPTHWIKQRADRGGLVMLHSRHHDNPAYYRTDGTMTPQGEAYMAKLDALTGVRRLRLRDGRWAAAEGVVYDEWDDAIHLVDRLPKGSESWPRYWAVDFGYSNPFVLQCWALDPDGRLWLYREIYRTKRLVEDHVRHILRLVRHPDGTWREPKPRAVICDHDAEDRATLERHVGFSTQAARKGVSDGIQAVQARLRAAGDGRPRLYVVRSALVERDAELEAAKKPLGLIEEIPGYRWPDGGKVRSDVQREAPIKEDDHSCDAMRYMVAARDLGGQPRVRWL